MKNRIEELRSESELLVVKSRNDGLQIRLRRESESVNDDLGMELDVEECNNFWRER